MKRTKLKNALTNFKSLGYYSLKGALGCVLIQHDKEGLRVIAYGNKSLSECEKRYRQTEEGALALVWAVEHFHIYLFGKQDFELITDNKPLKSFSDQGRNHAPG